MKIILCGLVENPSGDASIHCVQSMESLGIGYIGAVLEAAGHQIILQNNYDLEEIKKEIPQVVGFSVMTAQEGLVRKLARQIKEFNSLTTTVVGGFHPTGYPAMVMDPNIDFAVTGEGERTILQLVEFLEGKMQIEEVKGIAYKKNGKVILNAPQTAVQNLDDLPRPLRNGKILRFGEGYPLAFGPSGETHFAPITYARGCPGRCKFCISPKVEGHKVRYRSPEKVVEEMVYINKEFRVDHFAFSDPMFNCNPSRAIALCEQIIVSGLNVTWFCALNPTIFNEEMYRIMAKAGALRIGWGLETTREFRRILGKSGGFNQIKKSLQLCSDLGMINRGFLVLGAWENRKDIEEVKKMLIDLPLDDLRIAFCVPFPGTAFFEEYQGQFLNDDFSRWTTEEPILPNPNFSAEELIEIRKETTRFFFSSQKYRERVAEKSKRFPRLREPFKKFLTEIEKELF